MEKTCINEKMVCIIPARGGSKGVRRKNVKLLNGKPLIGWTIEEAGKSEYIDRIIVSTEDREISDTSKSFGAEVIDRPEELAQDASSTIDAAIHTLEVLKSRSCVPEYVMMLQCTSPLRRVMHIDESMGKFLSNKENADSLISVSKVDHPLWWYRMIDDTGYLKDLMEYDKNRLYRRQDFPGLYCLNGAIYIIKTQKLYEHKNFQTGKTLAYVMDRISAMDIDNEMDFMIAEFIMKNQNL